MTGNSRADVSLVQTTNSADRDVTNITATFGSAATEGNLLIAVCGSKDSITISGPSGFTTAINQTGVPSQGIFYKVADGGETNLTCASNSQTYLGIHIYEYSGMVTSEPLDSTGSASGSSDTPSSGELNTNTADTLLIAGLTLNTESSISGWSNSFTEEHDFTIGAGRPADRMTFGGAWRTTSTTDTYSTTATSDNDDWRGQIAAFRIHVPILSVDIVDSSGEPVSSPSVGLSSVDASLECQTTNGTLGTSNERIRINNTTQNDNWTLTMAATDGSGAAWSNGEASYSFNDSAGNPSGCDSGQLSLNPSTASIAPQTGCSSAGISSGSNAAFSQGVTDSITLLTATESQTNCYFDLTNVGLTQAIPPETPASGTPYSLNVSLTLTAN